MVVVDARGALVSRLDRALQRRDREAGRVSSQPDAPSRSAHDVDSHLVPVGLIDQFPLEPGGSENVRPSPKAPVTEPRKAPVTEPAKHA